MSNNLIWLDLEMSGLNPQDNTILEIAVIISDKNLNIIAEMDSIAIKQSASVLENMDEWNLKHHGASKLIERCLNSEIDMATAEKMVLEFIKNYSSAKSSPLCGNSIGQDRRFLYAYMPTLEQYFHYRNIDVSSLKELIKYWYQDEYKKEGRHEALADIRESIAELKFYRDNYFLKKEALPEK